MLPISTIIWMQGRANLDLQLSMLDMSFDLDFVISLAWQIHFVQKYFFIGLCVCKRILVKYGSEWLCVENERLEVSK